MPVRQISTRRQPTPEAQDLTRRLVDEWRASESNAAQPVILELRRSKDEPMELYVVWDEWTPLDGVERSEIIMDAFEQRYGRDEFTNVTVAMGLTAREADRMGVPYK